MKLLEGFLVQVRSAEGDVETELLFVFSGE